MTVEPGQYYRIVPLGPRPSGEHVVTQDGRTVRVRWASGTVQASSSCEPPGHNRNNVPVLHTRYLQSLADNDQLEPIDS